MKIEGLIVRSLPDHEHIDLRTSCQGVEYSLGVVEMRTLWNHRGDKM